MKKQSIAGYDRSTNGLRPGFRARRQIFLPAIAITLAVVTFVGTFFNFRLAGAIAPFSFVLAMTAQQFGPIRLRQPEAPYDEFEQILIWKSRTTGMAAALAIVILGCSALSVMDALGQFSDNDWHLLPKFAYATGWLLVTVATGVTTISASLLLPKQIDDVE